MRDTIPRNGLRNQQDTQANIILQLDLETIILKNDRQNVIFIKPNYDFNQNCSY